MATRDVKIVFEQDMGKSIEFGTTETDKWNVKHDDTLTIKADGSLSVVPPGCHRITNLNTMAGLPSGDGMYCIHGVHNNTTKTPGVPLAPNADAEAQGRYETGNVTADYDWNGVAVRGGNQLTVWFNSGGITWTATNDDGNNWSQWRRVEEMPQVQSGGLDCAAIGALPKREWKKGTTILAKQGDECVQLSALDSIFQEVGVGITANKTNGLTGETYHVVVTVTNSGEGTNDRTNLTITKPALGSYTTNNFTTSKSGANIARTDDWNYVITGLTRGGTAKVEFDVVPNGVGTFQFGASVNPNSSLDQQSNNNRATLTLSATTRTAPDYVPSVDCPFITAKHGQRDLLVDTDRSGPTSYFSRTAADEPRVNVLDLESLANVTITIKGVTQVVVRAGGYHANNDGPSVLFSNNKFVNHSARTSGLRDQVDSIETFYNTNQYTFDPRAGTLTLTGAFYWAQIYVRAGGNCKWQVVRLTAVSSLPTKQLSLTTTAANSRTTQTMPARTADQYNNSKVATWSLPWDNVEPIRYATSYASSQFTGQDSIVINIPAGRSTSFTVTASGSLAQEYFRTAFSQGAIQVAPATDKNVLNVTVASAVSTADSFTYKNVRFEVV